VYVDCRNCFGDKTAQLQFGEQLGSSNVSLYFYDNSHWVKYSKGHKNMCNCGQGELPDASTAAQCIAEWDEMLEQD